MEEPWVQEVAGSYVTVDVVDVQREETHTMTAPLTSEQLAEGLEALIAQAETLFRRLRGRGPGRDPRGPGRATR